MLEQAQADYGGERMILSGGAPQPLPTGVPLWLVTGGLVDLFLEHEGGRTFVLSAETGDCIFGMAGPSDAFFSVNGAEGASLESGTADELAGAELSDAADRWILGLGKLFVDFAQGSGQSIQLSAGERCTPPPASILCAMRGPLWAMIPAAGRVRLGDTRTVVQGPAAIPLAGGLWLRVLEPSAIWTETSENLGGAEALVDRLTAFNRLLPALVGDLIEARSAATLEHLHAAQSASDRQVRASLDTLTRSTLSPTAPLPSSASLGPVGAALARAFDALDIRIDTKKLASPVTELADVPSVARQAGVRARRVLLRPGWHREDLGTLVSARSESRAVVTLIPSGRRGYSLFDPESGRTRDLSGDEAAAIGPTAYSLYRPLTEKPQRIRDLIRFVWADIRRDSITALLAGAAVGLLATVVPIMTAVIIDTVIPSNESLLLAQLGIALALVAVFSFIFTITREIALHRINGRTGMALQAALWDRLLRLPTGFFRSYSAGDLAQRVAGIEAVRNAIVDVALGASLTLFFSSFNVLLLFIYAPGLAAIAAVLVVVLAAITFGAGLLQIRYGRKMAAVQGELSGLVFQYLQGVTKLRAAGAEARAFARWADRYAGERAARLKAGRIQNHYEAFSGSYQILSLTVLYGATVWLAGEDMRAGIFIAFLAAFGAFQTAFLRFARSALTVFAVLPQYERGKPILDAELENDSAKADPGTLKGNIRISRLDFGYDGDGPTVFDGLDLTVEAGQSVALVGPSGGGKSTLLRLLLGFERPSAGAILYDGQGLKSLDLSLLRRQIGVVLQTGRVFAGSILENIRGSADLTIDECLEAAQAAGLADDLAQMPMGLHTPLTEGASTLSGGQRQRILIARALAARPRILFLDEATSALDNRTQAIVTETLDRLGVTRIVVAHRLSTVRHADKICFIDQGRILEQGTFEELMAVNNHFAALASRQLL